MGRRAALIPAQQSPLCSTQPKSGGNAYYAHILFDRIAWKANSQSVGAIHIQGLCSAECEGGAS